jgi:hypothetical protein
MKNRMKLSLSLVCWMILSSLVGIAQAQSIYKCGPNGTEYSQAPCPGGKMIESSDPRSAAQRQEAARIAAQDRRLAADLERERRAQMAENKPAMAAGINGRPLAPPAAASAPQKAKTKKTKSKASGDKGDDFVALVPGPKKKRKSK